MSAESITRQSDYEALSSALPEGQLAYAKVRVALADAAVWHFKDIWDPIVDDLVGVAMDDQEGKFEPPLTEDLSERLQEMATRYSRRETWLEFKASPSSFQADAVTIKNEPFTAVKLMFAAVLNNQHRQGTGVVESDG